MLKRSRYYIGIAGTGQTLTIHRRSDAWAVSLPDGTQKTLPGKHLYPQPAAKAKRMRPDAPTTPLATPPNRLTRRTNQNGQSAFHKRLYFVGVAHKGQTLLVVPTAAGLEVYTTQQSWITTCPWKPPRQADKPLCPM